MLRCAINADGVALRVAWPDPYAQLQLVIQSFARSQGRDVLTGRQGLAVGPSDGRAGNTQGRSPAVIADGHVLVVGQQRVVRTKQFADVQRMVNAHIEIGVVTDPRRQVHRALAHGQQQAGCGLQTVALRAAFIQQL